MKLEDVGEVIRLGVPVRTVKQAARAVGTGEDKIVKTLVVYCKGEYHAYVIRGNKKLELETLGCRLATAEEVLRTTGYAVGGVPPVLNIPVYIDKDLLTEDYVYGGGGDEYTLLKFKPSVLVERGLAKVVEF
ncbi:MAG: YbaK/EbsC family protein [Pyrobaculum sp.]